LTILGGHWEYRWGTLGTSAWPGVPCTSVHGGLDPAFIGIPLPVEPPRTLGATKSTNADETLHTLHSGWKSRKRDLHLDNYKCLRAPKRYVELLKAISCRFGAIPRVPEEVWQSARDRARRPRQALITLAPILRQFQGVQRKAGGGPMAGLEGQGEPLITLALILVGAPGQVPPTGFSWAPRAVCLATGWPPPGLNLDPLEK